MPVRKAHVGYRHETAAIEFVGEFLLSVGQIAAVIDEFPATPISAEFGARVLKRQPTRRAFNDGLAAQVKGRETVCGAFCLLVAASEQCRAADDQAERLEPCSPEDGRICVGRAAHPAGKHRDAGGSGDDREC